MNIGYKHEKVQNGKRTTNAVVHASGQMTAALQVTARPRFKVLLQRHLKALHSPRDSARLRANSRHILVLILLLGIPVMYRYGFAMRGQYLKKRCVTMRRQQESIALLSLYSSLSKMPMHSRMHWLAMLPHMSPWHPAPHRPRQRDSRQRALWGLSVRWSRTNETL